MSRIDGYSAYQTYLGRQTSANEIVGSKNGKPDSRVMQDNKEDEAAIYEQSTVEKQVTYNKPAAVKSNPTADVMSNLSEAAKSLLEELKDKYGKDTDFIIANFSSDEEANALMAQGKKEYTVLIDPELLEKMAADDSVKENIMSEIDNAKGQVNSMLEELGEDADKIESIGISIAGDGTISYFAQMKEASDKRSEEIQEGLKERREEAKAERKEKDKERLEEHQNKSKEEKVSVSKTEPNEASAEKINNYLTANTIEELIALIREK